MQMTLSDSNTNQRIDQLRIVIDERDRQYGIQFRAAEVAVGAAFDAQKAAMEAAFAASKEAIGKAEEAQRAYNVVHNDLSRKMELQGKETMPRPETLGLFEAVNQRFLAMQTNYENRLDSQKAALEKDIESLTTQVVSLRESRSEAGGTKTGTRDLWGYFVAAAGLALALVFHFVK